MKKAEKKKRIKKKEPRKKVKSKELIPIDEEEMNRLLGFGGFGSTKGKQVVDNAEGASAGAAARHKERKYRQYMNRKGGFNRPLSKMP